MNLEIANEIVSTVKEVIIIFLHFLLSLKLALKSTVLFKNRVMKSKSNIHVCSSH